VSGPPDVDSADIAFTAEVNADRLRFGQVPETEVRFTGTPARESVSASDRDNLPDRVDADVNYREVRVDYVLATKHTDPSRGDDSPPSRRYRRK
jgi:hypothetical protein